eukprot:TRINITY_DN58460_c0_g1_i1.p2 TRINITY_DN58460_c0_g1~~TRINITY_DN58460_c0_g1_i1.p2  ORF type:complete len:110 (+),score=18.81 TRINITY_DN58460_c0_g1_i1:119-448(+)
MPTTSAYDKQTTDLFSAMRDFEPSHGVVSKKKGEKGEKAAKGKSKKGKSAKGEKGDKPKRKLSGYMLFSQKRRPEILKGQPDLKVTEVAKLLGAEWRKMTSAEKAKFDA